jgi:putative transposase
MPQWPHAPPHFLGAGGAYMVTAGTYLKAPRFEDDPRRELLHDLLLDLAVQYDWGLEAWAVFANHYHFVAQSPAGEARSLKRFLKHLHSVSARELNRLDSTPGRKIWHNFRETELTYEKSYFARLHYVHQNPVKHGMVAVASDYQWCSAAWFEREGSAAQVKKIYSFPIDRLKVDDDF